MLLLSALTNTNGNTLTWHFLGSERDWIGAHVVRRPKKAHLNFPGLNKIFFGKSVSAPTLGSIALTNANENLLGWIYFRVVRCLWVGGMKLADPVFLWISQWLHTVYSSKESKNCLPCLCKFVTRKNGCTSSRWLANINETGNNFQKHFLHILSVDSTK